MQCTRLQRLFCVSMAAGMAFMAMQRAIFKIHQPHMHTFCSTDGGVTPLDWLPSLHVFKAIMLGRSHLVWSPCMFQCNETGVEG